MKFRSDLAIFLWETQESNLRRYYNSSGFFPLYTLFVWVKEGEKEIVRISLFVFLNKDIYRSNRPCSFLSVIKSLLPRGNFHGRQELLKH